MKKKLLFLFILCHIASYNLIAQMDNEFWFAAPAISEYDPRYEFNKPIKFNIASFSNSPISVNISIPANPAFTPISETIPPNGFISIDMTPYLDTIVNTPHNTVLNRGILIQTSGGMVNVSYEVALGKNSTEVYSLKGKMALGTSFLFPGQDEYSNYAGGTPKSLNRMDIVAIENGTVVTITPSVDIAGIAANTPHTVTLNKGQTYSCIAMGIAPEHHFHGTAINANKPIAITQTDDNLNDGEGQDLIGDQIIPVNHLGQEYIAVKGTLRGNEEKVYILGVENATSVYVGSSSMPVKVINRGETLRLSFSGQPALYITSDKPIYAYQLTGISAEFGAAILPALECSGSDAVKCRRGDVRSDVFRFNLCVQTGGENNFLYNGNPGIITPSDFSDVPGTNGAWKYASKDFTNITPVNELAFVSNTSHKFQMGVFDGWRIASCAYSFYSGFGFTGSSELHATICQGDVYNDNNFTNLTQAGVYSNTLQNINGCDSIVYLTLSYYCPVSNITDVPASATVNVPLVLTGTVEPSNATNQNIVWSIVNAGTTNAEINDNTFFATSKGTAVVRASIANGTAIGTDYTEDFLINVGNVGIAETQADRINIYPNPAQGTLYVISAEAVEQVSVHDVSGKILLQTSATAMGHTPSLSNNVGTSNEIETPLSMDISTLANGIYLIKVKTAQGETVKKIVKQ